MRLWRKEEGQAGEPLKAYRQMRSKPHPVVDQDSKMRWRGGLPRTVLNMGHRIGKVVGTAAGALAIVGAVLAVSGSSDEPLNPAAEALADLPTVTDFSIQAEGDGCAFDQDRGGLVYKGLTITSKSAGVLELSFYVQRDSLDDILPGYVSTVLTFDDDSLSHSFDLVIPATKGQYEAGYDECRFSTSPG